MKRKFAFFCSLVLILGLCLPAAIPSSVSAAGDINLAPEGTFSSNDNGGYTHATELVGPEYLTDGLVMLAGPQLSIWASSYYQTRDVDVYIQYVFPQTCAVSKVNLYPRGTDGRFFPEDYDVQVSVNGTDWTTVKTVTGDTSTEKAVRELAFTETEAKYVRVHISKLFATKASAGYVTQISEIEIFGHYMTDDINLAPEGTFSSNDNGGYTHATELVGPEYLTDGLAMLPGPQLSIWAASYYPARDVNFYIQYEFLLTCTVSKVNLYPRGTDGRFFPEDYDVQVSMNGTDWTTVKTVTGDTSTEKAARELTFTATEARFVRVHVSKLFATKASAGYACQFSEIEIFGHYSADVQNLAKGITITSNDENGYVSEDEGYGPEYLTDGIAMSAEYKKSAWATDYYAGQEADIWVEVDLGCLNVINQVALYPRGSDGRFFPEDYEILVSSDGESWETVRTVTGDTSTAIEGRYLNFAPVEARFVRLHISKLFATKAGKGYVCQLSEMEVYGIASDKTPDFSIQNAYIWLEPGESVDLIVKLYNSLLDPAFEYEIEPATGVVSLDETTGTITAEKVGEAMITVTEKGTNLERTCKVFVVEDKSVEDNIVVSVPMWRDTYITEEHIQKLKEAEVDIISKHHNLDTKNATDDTGLEDVLAMIDLLKHTWEEGNRGMRVALMTGELENYLVNATDEEIKAFAERFDNLPYLHSYHVKDEPYDLKPWSRVVRILNENSTNAIAMINCLAEWCYPSPEAYEKELKAYVEGLGDTKDKTYLSFDAYPFTQPTGVDEVRLFRNFDIVRKVGLEYGVRTAFYAQATGFTYDGFLQYRRPDEGTLRYHISTGMAYGFKMLQYYTWFVSDSRPEEDLLNYTDAIIGKDGKPTELYYIAKEIHQDLHTIGTTLVNLDALQIYHSGSKSTATEAYQILPDNYAIQALDDSYAVLSVMVDKTTGRNYLMVVNKDFENEQTVKLKLNGIPSLQKMNKDTGMAVDISLDNGVLSETMRAGDFELYVLPENVDLINGVFPTPEPTPTPTPMPEPTPSPENSPVSDPSNPYTADLRSLTNTFAGLFAVIAVAVIVGFVAKKRFTH